MAKSLEQCLDSWKKADSAAHQCERELTSAWDAFYEGPSGPPSAALITRVVRLRQLASSRLAESYAAAQRVTADQPRPAVHRAFWRARAKTPVNWVPLTGNTGD